MKEVMNCSQIERIIDRWTESGSIPVNEYQSVLDHIESCPACSERFSYLLPFLERDATGRFGVLPEMSETSESLVSAVMEGIGNSKPQSTKVRPSRLLLAAAAAAIILFAGYFIMPIFHQNSDEVLVKFELTAPEAHSVSLVGDFNNWEPSKLILKDPDGDGTWEVRIKLKKGKVYTYNFLIDGKKWIADPNAPMKVKDDFGGESSLIRIEGAI